MIPKTMRKEMSAMPMRKLKKYKPTKFMAKDSRYDSVSCTSQAT